MESATDLCPRDEMKTMSHIVDSCPLTKLNGSLFQLHSADSEAVARRPVTAFDTDTRSR